MVLNAAVCVAFVAYCCHSTAALRAVCIHLSALAVMWRAMELLMLSVSHPARSWLGLTLAPHFINPFASTSLTDFWARRWNITQVSGAEGWADGLPGGLVLLVEPGGAPSLVLTSVNSPESSFT